MLRNFRKPSQRDKQRYLRYDDVFLGGSNRRRDTYKNSPNSHARYEDFRPQQPQQVEDDDFYFEESDTRMQDSQMDYHPYEPQQPPQEYFSGRNNIIDEKMIRYQRRQLPPLQRYSPNSHRDNYSEFNQSYWDEDYAPQKSQYQSSLKQLWSKFILTFASIISLVCVSWVIYSWSGKSQSNIPMTQDGIPVIEPDRDSFKVLPQNPGGAEIAYKDKTIYERVNNNLSVQRQESLLPPQEDASSFQNVVEEYSIVDDKTYYIKISAGKTKPILQNELNLLKKKFSQFIDDRNSAIKKVSNSSGEKKYAILIGPFEAQDIAIDTAKSIGGQCYVISVRE